MHLLNESILNASKPLNRVCIYSMLLFSHTVFHLLYREICDRPKMTRSYNESVRVVTELTCDSLNHKSLDWSNNTVCNQHDY